MQKFTKKRNMNLENVLEVLDETLNEEVKIRIVKRMRQEMVIDQDGDFE